MDMNQAETISYPINLSVMCVWLSDTTAYFSEQIVKKLNFVKKGLYLLSNTGHTFKIGPESAICLCL